MKSLLRELGAVCARCSTWTPPGIAACAGCHEELPVVLWLHEAADDPADGRVPAPEATPAAEQAPPQEPTPVAAPVPPRETTPIADLAPGPARTAAPRIPAQETTPVADLAGIPRRETTPAASRASTQMPTPVRGIPTPGVQTPAHRRTPAPERTPAPGGSARPARGGREDDFQVVEDPLDATDAPSVACAGCGRSLPFHLRFCPTCGTRVATRSTPGPPLEPNRVRLLLLRGAGPTAAALPLVATETTVGRDGCALRFPADDTVPRRAATLVFRGGRLLVRDAGAAAVFVRIRQPEVLEPGACFSIGDQLLRFSGWIAPQNGQPAAPAVFGSPLPGIAPHLRLEHLHLGGAGGAAWLRPAPVRIGRSTGDPTFPDDPFVSSRHCQLEAHPLGALLRDLGSSNGTFVQLPPGGERELQLGDTLRIGRNILRVEANE